MDHWHVPYLGLRHIPSELNEFELNTFFTLSSKERALIDARRNNLYRLALAMHIGFVRMAGRTLDACKQVPSLGEQLDIDTPDIGTLRALHDTRPHADQRLGQAGENGCRNLDSKCLIYREIAGVPRLEPA